MSHPPIYRRIAEDLRERIQSGHLRPGMSVPSETQLIGEYGVSRFTARAALRELLDDGLIERRRGHPYRVRTDDQARDTVAIQRGSRLSVRMPTAKERADLDIEEGVPVLTVEYGTRLAVYAGDRHVFTTS